MAGIGSRRRGDRTVNFWPAWVDALSTLLMVVTFVLLVFSASQFYLSNTLSGREQTLGKLNRQLAELGDLLAMERRSNSDLRSNIGQLSAELQAATAAKEQLTASLSAATAERDDAKDRLAQLSARAGETAGNLRQTGRELEDAYKVIAADRDKIDLSLREIASL